ncbi:50S ribosomal protein L5 [Patescibacteria group bacterium]|nr:50S ribosomal protein L5 [Patescibacteria group bacterium]MBU1966926.1 50S ribosomal protein L5 [Patescibacteria group bacterium]MBU2543726.1 50S ribosomal protein L5 [Patescibacteria group bacterium]
MNRLREKYQQKIAPMLQKELTLSSPMAVPQVKKVIVNMGVTQPAEPKARWQIMDSIIDQFKVITGQKPNINLARQSVAGFNLREGDPVGAMVTLRGQRMWEFLDKLINITLPRVKDFQGVSRDAFDGQGNYNLGLEEQIVFPEINYDNIDRVRGLQITIVTNTKENNKALRLLELLGMPFAKEK